MTRNYNKKGGILLLKGIDVSKPGEYIDSQSVRNSENFDISRSVITKRNGTSVVGDVSASTDLELLTGVEFVREGTKYNIRVTKDTIERYNSGNTTWSDITGTVGGGSILTGGTSDLVNTAIPLLSGKRILCVTNGIDDIRKWTASGDTAVLGGSPPKAKFIQEYKTYLVCANITGGTDIAQRMQWCDTAKPEEWTTGNAGAVDLEEDGGDITGLSLFGNYLAVHKDKSIYLGYLVSSTDIFKFDRKATGVGTVANNSIVNIPTGEQVFLAKDGIRVFNGISAPLIASPINDEIRDTINSQYAVKAWGMLVREKDEVWLGIPIGSQTTGQTIYKYNYNTKTVYKDTRTNVSTGWLATASTSLTWDDMDMTWDANTERWNGTALSTSSDQVNIGDTNGYSYKVDSTALSDDGTNITATVTTGDFQDSQDKLARFQYIELWAKGGSVTVQYSIDGGATWTEMSQSPFTLTDEYPLYTSGDKLWFDVVASTIRFKFSNSESDESLTIKQFIVGYLPREFR